MLKTRIILIVVSAVVILGLYMLPKVVVENDDQLSQAVDSVGMPSDPHAATPKELVDQISNIRRAYLNSSENQKKAIFADSLADLYAKAGKFDSAGWFAEEAAQFFNNEKSWVKAGENYYEAYSFALEADEQAHLAEKTREYLNKALAANPKNLEAKTKVAMTYVSSGNPMQGITMLREVMKDDPKNQFAIYNLGMLSVQSGQNDKAVERLKELVEINPNHIQGQLLLGVAYLNLGDKKNAKVQFEKVKDMDKDPAVQAIADSYLKDLK